ncbi:hypothetical protein QQX98_008041 [Neonectria punicea]|uniref:Uncharacterized protein n=1 Tax=Neonectria punicea TaxID=979145 RepID=A0ABR1GWB8_9HYPO
MSATTLLIAALVAVYLFAILGIASQPCQLTPEEELNAILKDLRTVLNTIESNVRPVLPVWFNQAVPIMAVIWWFAPRIAAAWDRTVEMAKTHQGSTSLFWGWVVAAIQFLAKIFSPFRLDEPGIAEMLDRTRVAEHRAVANEEEAQAERRRAETAKTNAEREKTLLQSDLDKERFHHAKTRDKLIKERTNHASTRESFMEQVVNLRQSLDERSELMQELLRTLEEAETKLCFFEDLLLFPK